LVTVEGYPKSTCTLQNSALSCHGFDERDSIKAADRVRSFFRGTAGYANFVFRFLFWVGEIRCCSTTARTRNRHASSGFA
jgi:hypothetical protein